MTDIGTHPAASRIRLSFSARVVIFSTLLVGLTVGLSSWLVYRSSKAELEASLGQELLAIGRSTASLVDSDLVELIYASGDGTIEFEDEFHELRAQLDRVRRINELPSRGNPIYIMRPTHDFDASGMLEFVVMPDPDESGRYFVGNLYPAEAHNREALAGNASASPVYTDSEGVWISASVPLMDSDGALVGLIQVDRSVDFFYERSQARAVEILFGALFSVFVGIVLAAFFARDLTGPLRAMAAALAAVGRGEFHRRLAIERGDEIGELASGFDWMAESLERHRESEQRARAAAEESARSKSQLLEDLDAVNRVLEVVASAESVETAIQTALDSLREVFGWAYGIHRELDPETEGLVARLESGELEPALRAALRDLPCKRGEGLAGEAWKREALVVAADLATLRGNSIWQRLADEGLELGLCLPLFVRGALVGTLELFARVEPDSDASLSASRRDALRNVGRLLSGAMDRMADAEERAQAAASTFALNRVLEALSAAEVGRSVDEVVHVAVAIICEAFGWSYGVHWTDASNTSGQPAGATATTRARGSDSTALIFAAEAGVLDAGALSALQRASYGRGEGLPGRSWAEAELVFAEDWSPLDAFAEPARGAGVRSPRATSAVALPLIVLGEVTGVLGLFGGAARELSPARLDALRDVGRLVSGKIERLGEALARASSGETAARVMAKIAEGDLRQRMSGEYVGEFQVLQGAINDSTTRLGEMVREIRDGSLVIARAASDVAAGSTVLFAHTERQESSLQHCTASVADLAHAVTQNSERSRRATDLADETKGLAERCGEMMHKTVAAMADIGVSGREIEVITDVIDDITRKTRLLALNASIEAGRAGEHGLGFAVVSSEIAALAERSSIAAQQIHDLVDESARRIATGSELVDESSSALREIVSATASAGELISDMVVASSEQAAGVEQVRRVVEELHEVTLQNAVLVSQSVDASGEMAEKAASLTRLVEFFKIDSDSPREDDAG